MLHSSLSSSSQWRGLVHRLGDRACCLAMDLYGYGNTPMPDIREAGEFTLWQEVALVETLLNHTSVQGPLRLVGHSYGAAVALAFAQQHPDSIQRLVLFEPVCFSILEADCVGLRDLASVLTVFDDPGAASKPTEQARRFIEYWNGPGAFKAMPVRLQQLFAQQVSKVSLDFKALMHPTFTVEALKPLATRLTLMHGDQTRSSAFALIQQLQGWLPETRVVTVSGGHMAPLTHEEEVNTLIEHELQLNE